MKMIEYEDKEFFEADSNGVESGNLIHSSNCFSIGDFQNEMMVMDTNGMIEKSLNFYETSHMRDKSMKSSIDDFDANYFEMAESMDLINKGSTKCVSDKIDVDTAQLLAVQVNKLEQLSSDWKRNGVRKAKSPSILVCMSDDDVRYNFKTMATIDEGSEINCLDDGFAAKCGIRFSPTDCRAKAAGSAKMSLVGQSMDELTVSVVHSGTPIKLSTGKMVIVKNLGVDMLLGEPCKRENEIITIPHQSMIEFKKM